MQQHNERPFVEWIVYAPEERHASLTSRAIFDRAYQGLVKRTQRRRLAHSWLGAERSASSTLFVQNSALCIVFSTCFAGRSMPAAGIEL